jgi:hypothetical protein
MPPPFREHCVDLQRCPVVAPGFGVHRQRVAFVVVDLSTAAHDSVPGAWTGDVLSMYEAFDEIPTVVARSWHLACNRVP